MAAPPYWMTIARRYLGLTEVPGPAANPTLLDMAKNLGGWVAQFFVSDETPWCALFVNRVLQEAGLSLSGRAGSVDLVRARSFATYGIPLEVPCLGAILVFERQGGGHVGFYVGETLKAYRVLGGNQSNSVNETWIAKDRCIAVRWPDPATRPGSHVWLRPDASLFSTNEQ